PPAIALRLIDTAGKASQADGHVPAQAELTYLFKAPWQSAVIYTAAGSVFAVVMTIAWLVATRDPRIPISKVLLLFLTFFWPAVLTVNLVAGVRRNRLITVCAYFGMFLAVVVMALARS